MAIAAQVERDDSFPMSDAEWKLRVQLAAAYHLVDHFGWFGLEARTLDLSRTLGIGALILGTWLVIR